MYGVPGIFGTISRRAEKILITGRVQCCFDVLSVTRQIILDSDGHITCKRWSIQLSTMPNALSPSFDRF